MSAPALPNTSPLRGKVWRGRGVAKLVWLYLAPTLSGEEPRPIKINSVARALDIGRQSMRRAVRLLVRRKYLHCVDAPTMGTAGLYVFGPRAYREPHRAPVTSTGIVRRPVGHPDQLSLLPVVSEAADHGP